MTESQQTPIAYFMVTQLHFVCPDCVPDDDKNVITFYDEEELIGYYNDLHIGFESQEHQSASEGDSLIVTCRQCEKNLAEGNITHELSDIFAE